MTASSAWSTTRVWRPRGSAPRASRRVRTRCVPGPGCRRGPGRRPHRRGRARTSRSRRDRRRPGPRCHAAAAGRPRCRPRDRRTSRRPRRRTAAGHGTGSRGWPPVRAGRQRGILPQQLPLEPDQLATRVQAELVDQHGASPLHRAEGLALPAGLVESRGQQRPAPLPERGLATSARACSAPPVHDRIASPPRHAAPRRPSQTRPAARLHPPRPHSSRSVSARPRHSPNPSSTRNSGAVGVVPLECLPPPLEEPFERPMVELVVAQREAVARRHLVDGRAAQDLAQPPDAAIHDLRPGGRQRIPPQRIREGLRCSWARGRSRPAPRGPLGPSGSVRSRGRRPGAGRGRRYPWFRMSTPCPGQVNGADIPLIPLRQLADISRADNGRKTASGGRFEGGNHVPFPHVRWPHGHPGHDPRPAPCVQRRPSR